MKTIIKSILILALAILALSIPAVCRAQSVSQDLSQLFKDTLGSTNMVYAPFAERKLTGNANSAGLIGAYNFNGNVAAIGGLDWQWSRGNASATYNLSGGLQLQTRIYPLSSFGLTNFYVNPFVVTAVGTPINGSNNGNLMNANRVGANIPIHTFIINKNPLAISVGGFYGNQTGTGKYDGNWAGVDVAVNYGNAGSLIAANDTYLEYAYENLQPDGSE